MDPIGTPTITTAEPAAASPRARRQPKPKSGGRPSLAAAAQLGDTILAAATTLFLRSGYADTSMESVAKAAGVSKRTLYARFPDKPTLLQHAVARLIAGWLEPFDPTSGGDTLEAQLLHTARHMLRAALMPEALALHRLVVAECSRVPELAAILGKAGAAIGISHIEALLAAAGTPSPIQAAEQFQTLVVATPQRRALGLGPPLDSAALDSWAATTVRLFLHGALAKG